MQQQASNASNASALLDAFRLHRDEIDDGDVRFLLEILEHASEEDWEPLFEPFVADPTEILCVLRSHSNAVAEAKEGLLLSMDKEVTATSTTSSTEAQEQTEEDPMADLSLQYTCIPGAHNRAISLQQLRRIVNYLQSQADAQGRLPWVDNSHDHPDSPTYGIPLTLRNINLYHVVDFIIKPWTAPHQCSMVELLASHEQPPQWFVSHAWREPVCEMLASLTEHAKVRGLDLDNTMYWVCGYANNQHNLSQDMAAKPPNETSFYRALQQCEGMILCLDSLGTPFSRIWCCFEQAMTIVQQQRQQQQHDNNHNNRLLLDIATVVNDGTTAVVITDGRAAPVPADLKEGPKFALEFKRDRESGFPLELLEKGYEIDICAAQAAKAEDRRRILNTIRSMSNTNVVTTDNNTNMDIMSAVEPNLTDPAFAQVNKVLRGIFAEAAARKAAEAGRIDTVIDVLKQDTLRTKLTLNLGGCAHLDLTALSKLACHEDNDDIHQHNGSLLQELTVDCSYSGVTNVPKLGEALAGFKKLRKLSLNFEWCTTLQEHEIVQLSESGISSTRTTLTDLSLDFTGCSFPVFLPKIEVLQSLESLFINYKYTPTATIAKTLLGILQLRRLRVLHLRFRACQNVTHVRPLKKLAQLANLETLVLDFDYTYLSDVDGLSSLLELKHLSKCNLSFVKCTQISHIPWLTKLAHQDGLQLTIDLSECKGLEPSLQARFKSRNDLIQAVAASGSSDNNLHSSPTMFTIGEEIDYYSRSMRMWLPAVVDWITPDEEIDIRVQGTHQSFPRKIIRSAISGRVRRKHSRAISLQQKFEVGEAVEYFARDWKRVWLPAVIDKVETNALRVNVTGYDFPRRIEAADIPIQIRKVLQQKKQQYNVGDPVEYLSPQDTQKGWCPAIVHKTDPRGIKIRTIGNPEPQRVLNRDLSHNIRPMQTRKGEREPMLESKMQAMDDARGAAKRGIIADASHGDKSRLLKQFRASESVEYFSTYHKGTWMPAIVQKIDSNALRIHVAGYRDARRVLAADIPTKIRKTDKQKKPKNEC